MKRKFRFSIAALMSAAIVAVGLLLGSVTANAQPLPWNPPCANATIYNTTGCTAQLNLWTTPPGSVPIAVIPPCGVATVPTPPPGLLINGVISQAGAFVPMVIPGPVPPPHPCPFPIPPSPGVPANGWVRGVVLGPPPGCCFDVYFYSNADPLNPCTIWLFPGTPKCTP